MANPAENLREEEWDSPEFEAPEDGAPLPASAELIKDVEGASIRVVDTPEATAQAVQDTSDGQQAFLEEMSELSEKERQQKIKDEAYRIKKERKGRRKAVRLKIKLERKAIKTAERWRRLKIRMWESVRTIAGIVPQGLRGFFEAFKKNPGAKIKDSELPEEETNNERR